MPPIPDDAPRLNPLTESVPGDFLILRDDFAVGLEHPTTDDDLDYLSDLPAFFDDLYELLRAYQKYSEGDTGRTPFEDVWEDFLESWAGTPLITTG